MTTRTRTGYERRNPWFDGWDPDLAITHLNAAYEQHGRPPPPTRYWCQCGTDFTIPAARDKHATTCTRPKRYPPQPDR